MKTASLPSADAWLADESDGWETWDAYCQEVRTLLDSLAAKYGYTTHCDRCGISRYVEFYKDDDSFQVRISTHKQRYSGPVWSFEPTHSDQLIQLGLKEIEARLHVL